MGTCIVQALLLVLVQSKCKMHIAAVKSGNVVLVLCQWKVYVKSGNA